MTKVSIDSSFSGQMHSSRKTLQTIQPSADVPKSLEVSKKTVCNPGKNSKIKETPKKTMEVLLKPGKENVITLRRSKRRNAISNIVNTVSAKINETSSLSPVKNQKLSTKSVPKQRNSTLAVKKIDKNSKQSKLSFLPVPSTSTCLEDLNSHSESKVNQKPDLNRTTARNESSVSAYDVHLGELTYMSTVGNNITVFSDIDEANVLTDKHSPLQYWKELAEERRIALEKALYENELLLDQLAVLEAENSQLKALVNEAKELASVVQGIIQ